MARHDKHILDSIRELQRLSDLFVIRREQLARGVGLTVGQWHVLEEISDEHFMPSMFARRRESSAAAVSRTIRQLIDKGLVQVGVSDDDGRMRKYRLTDAGHDVMQRLRKNRSEAIQAVWGNLDPAELDAFRHFSARLSRRLEDFASSRTPGTGDENTFQPADAGTDNQEAESAPVLSATKIQSDYY